MGMAMRVPVREDIQLWCEAGVPRRLVWRRERWRVIDTPTLQADGNLWDAWRFTARSDQDHRTVVVDVERVGERWLLVAAWD